MSDQDSMAVADRVEIEEYVYYETKKLYRSIRTNRFDDDGDKKLKREKLCLEILWLLKQIVKED